MVAGLIPEAVRAELNASVLEDAAVVVRSRQPTQHERRTGRGHLQLGLRRHAPFVRPELVANPLIESVVAAVLGPGRVARILQRQRQLPAQRNSAVALRPAVFVEDRDRSHPGWAAMAAADHHPVVVGCADRDHRSQWRNPGFPRHASRNGGDVVTTRRPCQRPSWADREMGAARGHGNSRGRCVFSRSPHVAPRRAKSAPTWRVR